MKKLTLLCLASETDATLAELRDRGVLHVTPVKEANDQALESVRHKLEQTASAFAILDRHRKRGSRTSRDAPHLGAARAGAAGRHDASELDAAVRSVHTLTRLRKEFAERMNALREERSTMLPFGDFDPEAVDRLARKGIHVKLYLQGGSKTPEPSEGQWLYPLTRTAAGQHFAVVSLGGDVHCSGCEFVPHHRPLSVVEDDLGQAQQDIDRVDGEIARIDGLSAALTAHANSLREQERFLHVRAGMGNAGAVVYLQGFCPADAVTALRKAAERYGWGLLLADPGPDDKVPTLLRNPAWIRPINALFEFLRVTPGYRETDISGAFLLFYSIFFAMLVGDAGYGLIFLASTFLLRRFVPQIPRDVTRLIGLLGVCTIAWGALTGTWFSVSPLPAPLARLRVDWLRNDANLMGLCFLLGAIHLSIAHGWAALRARSRLLSLSELGWIAVTWTMYFAARTLIMDKPFPRFVLWMLFVPAVVVIALFMTPPRALRDEFHKHIMLPLTLISNFGDLVSYVRLFAVGSATAAISVAFNEMAVGDDGIRGAGDAVAAIAILLAAHGLNILLCALAVIVHGVRLNTLEFCGHMGIQWTGFAYRPFARDDVVNGEPRRSAPLKTSPVRNATEEERMVT